MKTYLTIAAVLVALGFGAAWRFAAVREGRAIERGRVADSLLVVAQADVQRLAGQYRVDTLRLTKWRTRLDTLRDSLTITDTVEVLRYVAVADSTIKACTSALSTCELRVGAERAVAIQWKAKYEAERSTRPTFIGKWTERIILLGAGYGAGRYLPQ